MTFVTALGGELPEDHLPSHVLKELPAWMDEFVQKTMVVDADKRWQTAEEVLDFLNAAIDEEVHKTIANSHTTSPEHAEKTLYLKDMKPGMKVSPSMTLHEILGRGGFGRVFKVWHDMQKQFLAIKIFEKDASIDNAINEFNALKELHHPNIVEFKHNDRTVPGGLFFTLMELLDGENLQEYTKGDLRLPADEIFKMATQILSAFGLYAKQKSLLCTTATSSPATLCGTSASCTS